MRKIIEELLTSSARLCLFQSRPRRAFCQSNDPTIQAPQWRNLSPASFEKKPAAVVVPVTTDGNVVCVIQAYLFISRRFSLRFLQDMPRIMRTPAQTAMRELVEETGYVPAERQISWQTLSGSWQYQRTCKCFSLHWAVKEKHEQKLDKDEFITTLEIPKDEIKRLMDEGEIKDANTFIALAKARLANHI